MGFVNVRDKIMEFVSEEIKKTEYKLVDVLVNKSKNTHVEIAIDKDGGITLGECSEFNKKVTFWIDEEHIIQGFYTLDVCSPGLDRELKSETSFLWGIGKKVAVSLHNPIEGNSVVKGKLVKRDDNGAIDIEVEGKEILQIERENIAKVKLEVSI